MIKSINLRKCSSWNAKPFTDIFFSDIFIRIYFVGWLVGWFVFFCFFVKLFHKFYSFFNKKQFFPLNIVIFTKVTLSVRVMFFFKLSKADHRSNVYTFVSHFFGTKSTYSYIKIKVCVFSGPFTLNIFINLLLLTLFFPMLPYIPSENLWFSDIFRGHKNTTLGRNNLKLIF